MSKDEIIYSFPRKAHQVRRQNFTDFVHDQSKNCEAFEALGIHHVKKEDKWAITYVFNADAADHHKFLEFLLKADIVRHQYTVVVRG